MSYTDLRDFECEYGIIDTTVGIGVLIEKLGGGTVGKEYVGKWRYIAFQTLTGKEIARGQDYHCSAALTHEEAAYDIAELFDHYGTLEAVIKYG